MNLIECWKDLTPEQREALVKACNDRCADAEASLTEEKKAVAALAARVSALAEEKARMEQMFREDFDRLTSELRTALESGMRARNQLCLIAQHMPDIVSEFLAAYEHFTDEALAPEFRERRKNAVELMRLLEPFAK